MSVHPPQGTQPPLPPPLGLEKKEAEGFIAALLGMLGPIGEFFSGMFAARTGPYADANFQGILSVFDDKLSDCFNGATYGGTAAPVKAALNVLFDEIKFSDGPVDGQEVPAAQKANLFRHEVFRVIDETLGKNDLSKTYKIKEAIEEALAKYGGEMSLSLKDKPDLTNDVFARSVGASFKPGEAGMDLQAFKDALAQSIGNIEGLTLQNQGAVMVAINDWVDNNAQSVSEQNTNLVIKHARGLAKVISEVAEGTLHLEIQPLADQVNVPDHPTAPPAAAAALTAAK